VEVAQGRIWSRLSAFVVGCRELRSYSSYLRRASQSEFYGERWETYLLPWSKRYLPKWFRDWVLRSGAVSRLLKWIELLTPSDKRAELLLKEICPDVVVASPTNMSHSEEIEYLKAAKRLRIPTAIPVLSWDNLTTKGLLAVHPDMVLAWNKNHEVDAISVHGIPKERIRITGSPFFDKWIDIAPTENYRSTFLERVGIPIDSWFVFYLGSSISVAQDELAQITKLQEVFASSKSLKDIWILARPHPSNSAAFRTGKIPPQVVVWPSEGSLPDSEQNTKDFFHSLYFSGAAIGLNTTGMVDAIALGKACITWLESQRSATQTRAVHFQELLRGRATYLAFSAFECGQLVEQLRRGQDPLMSMRDSFSSNFLRPRSATTAAGEFAAHHLQELAGCLASNPKAQDSTSQLALSERL
jgi:hypothetical protein